MTKRKYGPDSETHKTFLNCKSNFIIFGGGAGCGKSHQALLLILKYIKDPFFRAVFIRETSTQLSQSGGLFQEARDMWEKDFGATFKTHPNMQATFPSGAQVQFKVCGADRDISNYDGGQYSLVIFDEGQNHTETQIRYLSSRIRSKAKAPHQLILTCNPKSNHEYLLKFVRPYLDPATGIPLPEMFAKEMWFGAYGGETVVAPTKEELEAKYPGIFAQTYTFIAATIKDNPRMKKLRPEYVAKLENLKRVERERLLLGSWFAKETTAGFFKRDWVEELDKAPDDIVLRVRGMDMAGSLPSESYPNPDWTASVLMSRTKSGHYIVEHVERYRKLSNSVLEHIVETDRKDKGMDINCTVYCPQDPGNGGQIASMYVIKYLVEHGVNARPEKGTTTGKLARMQPFLSLAEAGLVKVVKSDWCEAWYNELEDYVDGNRQQKDDMWDATATAAKALLKQVTLPTFSIPTLTQPSPVPTI